MEIIRGRLSPQDFSNPTLRYNPDTDMIEYSPDGGVTWNPDPADDPRHSPKFAKPLRTGSSIQCDSAASVVAWMRNFIEYETGILTLGAGVAGVGNAMLTLLSPISPYLILFKVVFGVAETLFDIGSVGLATAFTNETYDLMLCCVFCNMEGDGTVTPGDLEDMQAQVNTDLNTTAALITNLILSTQGEVGVQNAGTLYDVAGDCDACACAWCWHEDLLVSMGGYVVDVPAGWTAPFGEYVSGTGFVAGLSTNPTYGYYARIIGATNTSLPPGNYRKIEVFFEQHPGSPEGNNNITLDGDSVFNAVADGAGEIVWEGNVDNPASFNVSLNPGFGGGDPGGSTTWAVVRYSGFGDNPFGADNC